MPDMMLVFNKVTGLDDAHAIASMKRGSRRGAARKTPVDTSHWIPDQIVIAFPGYVALPVAASN